MKKQLIDARLDALTINLKEPLAGPIRYALLGEGKRIRPQIVLSCLEMFGEEIESGIDPACAIEMLHIYSLIHDDLPCMDDDDWRRGKPTVHKVYGEALALLAGDFLLTYAFEVLAKAPLSPSLRVNLIEILAHCGGGEGMIGGQAIDIDSVGKKVSYSDLLNMHQGKTGALFKASFLFGGKIGNRSQPELDLLVQIAADWGLAYQYCNDLDNALHIGSDSKKKKPNAISLFGIEGTSKEIKTLISSLIEKLDRLPDCPSLTHLTLNCLAASLSNTQTALCSGVPTKLAGH
jgi:geranylgeranyl pyrophosphate synthase